MTRDEQAQYDPLIPGKKHDERGETKQYDDFFHREHLK